MYFGNRSSLLTQVGDVCVAGCYCEELALGIISTACYLCQLARLVDVDNCSAPNRLRYFVALDGYSACEN